MSNDKLAKAPAYKGLTKQATQQFTEVVKTISELLSSNPTPAQLALVYHSLDKEMLKTLEGVKTIARDMLLDVAKEAGGDSTVEYSGTKFRVEARASRSSLTADQLRTLLKQKKVKNAEDYLIKNVTVSYTPDKDKLQALVDSGKVQQEELDNLRVVKSHALYVTKL
jgi:hypothetical protein